MNLPVFEHGMNGIHAEHILRVAPLAPYYVFFTARAYFTVCVYQHLAILSFMCHLGDFQFAAVMNEVVMNNLVYFPCAPPPAQELLHDTNRQVELMGHRA